MYFLGTFRSCGFSTYSAQTGEYLLRVRKIILGLIITPSLIGNALHTKKPALIRCWIGQFMYVFCDSLLFHIINFDYLVSPMLLPLFVTLKQIL
jgi:hypothetical protein